MNALFDSAALAIVAYADVASDGTSTVTNSGVTTTKTSTGVYSVTLPSDKTQATARDLIFVQPMGSGSSPRTSLVDDSSTTTKVVRITDGSSLADGEFKILILRTIVPPPALAPA
jgi:hypothetical protein